MMADNKTPQEILALVNSVGSMALCTDTPGPLMILTTVHKAKVRLNMLFRAVSVYGSLSRMEEFVFSLSPSLSLSLSGDRR